MPTSSSQAMGTGASTLETDILEGVLPDYYNAADTDIMARWSPLTRWLDARLDAGLDPYSKYTATKISPEVVAFDRAGRACSGLNFASQDYLSLATDNRVIDAAVRAVRTYGVHSAGSAALMGLTELTIELERRVADFLGVDDATIFPTGWGAGYGFIRTFVRPDDHVVIDILAHACLQEGADAATGNVQRFPHCSHEAAERRIARIRATAPAAGILVVTETVFSMDSDIPDIARLQDICRRHGATLMVDVAHDLGALGPTGRGYLEIQEALGDVDVIMGSFSKSFASNGGFIASDRRELKLAMRYGCGPLTFTNAMSPGQAATVLACLDIIQSAEGAARRAKLLDNVRHMRRRLTERGFELLGGESAIIPVVLGGNARSRKMTGFMLDNGALVNLVEYPAVSRNGCRWRVQVMHDHTFEQIDRFVEVASMARESAG